MSETSSIRVLCISHECSFLDGEEEVCLAARYEHVMKTYAKGRIVLGLAYMSDDKRDVKVISDGIEYYAVHGKMGLGISDEEWDITRKELLRIIDEFNPDVIHCFGAEWPYGRIAEYTDVPVVIHVMGFLQAYYESLEVAYGITVVPTYNRKPLSQFIHKIITPNQIKFEQELIDSTRKDIEHYNRTKESELSVMKSNRFFMGRTGWDKNIVRYYSPEAKYFHVDEAVKPSVYAAAGQWRFQAGEKLRLFSLSLADNRKGNEIILRTAKILKNLIGLDFEWVVAGASDCFPAAESRCGINHNDVNVNLIGRIGTSRIIKEMTKARLSVHPSLIDNSPHSICEAQLIGCPIIASNVGGVPQLIEDGVTGWLYPYNEPHTLAFLIANIWSDEKLLTSVSQREVEVSLRRHDPETIANDLISSYTLMIEESVNRG